MIHSKIPIPPATQTLTCTTFRQPPMDGSLTILDMCEWHHKHSTNHRLFVFPRLDGSVHSITWGEAVDAMYRGVHLIQERVKISALPGHSAPIIAMVAQSETISYGLTRLSIMRSNFIPFMVSPRNSPDGLAHLLSIARVQHVLFSEDATCSSLVEGALAILQKNAGDHAPPLPSTSPILVYEDFFPITAEEHTKPTKAVPLLRNELEDIVTYCHSSGSTSHPKLIPWTNRKLLGFGATPFYGERDLTDSIVSMHTMPMFHGYAGLLFSGAFCTGFVISCFQPQSPAILPTADNVLASSKATDTDYIPTVPSFCEEWSHYPERLEWVKKGGLIPGGGPLTKEAGDKLVAAGIPVSILFGLSEIGPFSIFLPKSLFDEDWEYFKLNPQTKIQLVPQGDGTHQVILVPSPACLPCLYNTKVDGEDAYNTSDLVVPHPTRKGYWKVVGRTDDLIVHANGEKTNPSPLEAKLSRDPHIRSAIVFGRGQFQVGVLVEPEHPEDFKSPDEFRTAIWPTVEKMNTLAPQHSRLFKEMILVADPTKPFKYTSKNSVRRQVTLKEYDDEVSMLYENVKASTQPEISTPLQWDLDSCRIFIRKVIKSVFQKEVGDDDDLFLKGCDSLQATWIRNTFLRAVRDTTKLDTRQAPWNLVYDHSTITKLSSYLLHVVTHHSFTETISPKDSKLHVMRDLVEKYSGHFPYSSNSRVRKSVGKKKVVLLTGSTGGFGSFVLARLITDGDVTQIYAMNRMRSNGAESLQRRQQKAFQERGLDEALLMSEKLKLLEANLLEASFALSSTDFQEMQKSVTHIIHNAWPVNFNLDLLSFEPMLIGLRNLLNFAIDFGACFLFASSVGVLSNTSENCLIAEKPTPPQTALGSGYTESKWVAEEIILNTSQQSGLHAVIVRLGQICGSSKNGAWNTQEWVPTLIQSSVQLGCIPTDDRVVSWISPQMASSVIVEFLDRVPTPGTILHIRNPHPVSWTSLAKIIATELKVEIASYAEWLETLEARCGEGQNEINAIYLLPFFQSLLGSSDSDAKEAFGIPLMDIQNAKHASRVLAHSEMYKLGETDVKWWIRYWRKTGYI
ncbi:acetyl-CoA synthetase-like protein [Marasmius fiardii PR-910]|nr:acetyl-CoA synthetase-like protein [Marasmius fiardii PR-910]